MNANSHQTCAVCIFLMYNYSACKKITKQDNTLVGRNSSETYI